MSKLINYVGHLGHLDETKDLAANMAKSSRNRNELHGAVKRAV
jgi:hypothetical protein